LAWSLMCTGRVMRQTRPNNSFKADGFAAA